MRIPGVPLVKSLLFALLIAFSVQLPAQLPAAPPRSNGNIQIASLHPGLVWQRTSPARGQIEGPVLYQLLFSASGTPGTLAKFDTNPRHLTDSLIRDNGSLVTIGGMSVDGGSGVITFANTQTFPASGLPAIGGDVTGPFSGVTVVRLHGVSLSSLAPTANQVLQFIGGAWTPASIVGGAGGTVTSVGSGLGLTATPNPIIATGTLAIDTSVVPQLGAADNFTNLLTFSGGTLHPPTGTATAGGGFNSNALDLFASAYNTSAGAAVNQKFRWQAEPINNNSANPGATLNLLFSVGGVPPSETGLSIASNGQISFAAAQSFPGAVTSVTAGNSTITIGGTASAPTVGVGTISASNIASGQVVKSLNGLFDSVTLAAGPGLSLTPSGQTLTLANTGQIAPAWNLGGNAGTLCGASPCNVFVGTTDSGAALEFRVQNSRAYRIEPATENSVTPVGSFTPNVVGGFSGNNVTTGVGGATIGGGGMASNLNRVTDDFGTVGGGANNQAGNNTGTTHDAPWATVAGGLRNTASGSESTVAGGAVNTASGVQSIVAGGAGNTASSDGSVVAGGLSNTASGFLSTVVGGQVNTASGTGSFAAGQNASADQNGCFVWGDASTFNNTTCGGIANRFVVRASGGTVFYSNSTLTSGVSLAAGGGSWSTISDRNVKANFVTVDGKEILARVIAMPVTTWNYTSQAASIRHIGPMAQDFYATFKVGEDDKHITTIDEGGVALAAIQGLNQKLEEESKQKDAEMAAQAEQIRILREQVSLQAEQMQAIALEIGRLKTARDSEASTKLMAKE